MESYKNALHNFITDFADGGAIRHLSSLGYSVSEIMGRLDYPLPRQTVAQKVWEYYLEIGKICLEKTQTESFVEKKRYVKVENAAGRPSYCQVTERIPTRQREYIACDFGRRKYQDPEGFALWLQKLEPSDREYVEDLPWPLTVVYHEADERMKRIASRM